MSMLKQRTRTIVMLNNRANSKDTNTTKKGGDKTSSKKNKKALSKSTTCLNNMVALEKGLTKSSSCSALDLPLPQEPDKKKLDGKGNMHTVSIYDDDFQASIMLKENAAYRSRDSSMLASVSVSAMVDKISKGNVNQEEGHEYEQLEQIELVNKSRKKFENGS